MANINAYLKTTSNGDPGPQHKRKGYEAFEFSEGSDGATHTKIVDINGNLLSKIPVNVEFPELQKVEITNPADPVEFPANQNVTDAGVKTELELIKDQQAQILARLDAPIDTRLTGSNVAKGIPVQVEKDFIEIEVSGADLGAGQDRIFDVYANEGEIWTLHRFGYSTSRNQEATGNQSIWLYHGESNEVTGQMVRITGEATQLLQGAIPGYRSPVYGGEPVPVDIFELVETIRNTTVLSHTLPIRIRFRNQSDMTQSSHRFKLFFMVEKVNNVDE